jgi:hypothetical protein
MKSDCSSDCSSDCILIAVWSQYDTDYSMIEVSFKAYWGGWNKRIKEADE